jgi:hypothetical protein
MSSSDTSFLQGSSRRWSYDEIRYVRLASYNAKLGLLLIFNDFTIN